MARRRWLLALGVGLAVAACGPSAPSSTDGGGAPTCNAFDCNTIAECSSLSVAQCDGLCACYPQRWTAGAWESFSGCLLQCQGVGDSYSTCYVVASGQQPTFVNPQYISNCDAKRSVCPAYPTDACDPVTLAMLSQQSFDDLVGCLGEPCDGSAEACVDDVLFCGVSAP